MCKQMLYRASGLSYGIGQRNASFFYRNQYSPRSKRLTDRCNSLAPIFVTMKFSSACMNNCNGRFGNGPCISKAKGRV
jgi:hypothetical protein